MSAYGRGLLAGALGLEEPRTNWKPSRLTCSSPRRYVILMTLVVFHSFLEAKEIHIVEESVEAGISFSALSHEASECNGGSLAGHLSFFVNLISKVRHDQIDFSYSASQLFSAWYGDGRLTSAISIWTEAWSFATMRRLVAEHFLGMYLS